MTHVIMLLHPRAQPDCMGYIPDFLHEDDPRPAAVQFNERYTSGGWQPSSGWRLDMATGLLHSSYPEDPPLLPIAALILRQELVVLYTSEYVCIMQKDGSYEVARMD